MGSYLRKRLSLVILAGLSALGCDDGQQSAEQVAPVRAKTQAALVGETCAIPADCDDPCWTDETCTAGTCVAFTPETAGIACDDGNSCTTGATCDGGGVCGAAVADGMACDADANTCTTDQCAGGLCVFNSNNTDPCDTNANLCDNEVCNGAGTCTAGTPVDCSGTTDADSNDCVVPACNPATGACEQGLANATDGDACDTDADLCDGEICAAGTCGGGTPVDCSGTTDLDTNDCVVPACNPANGLCEQALANATDGDACDTDADLCDGEVCAAGTCGGGTPVDCSGTTDADSDDCVVPACNPANGLCEQGLANATNGAVCNSNSDLCDNETCNAGACNAGTPVDCSGTVDADTNDCVVPACNPATGSCEQGQGNETNGTFCNSNANLCDNETCNAGSCNAGTPVDCSGVTDLNLTDCSVPACNPANGICEQGQGDSANGASCDTDGDLCDGESCDGSGTCGAGPPVDCSGTTDLNTNDCLVPECNPATGSCEQGLANAANGVTCNSNADLCDNETCNGAGTCVTGAPVDCSGTTDLNTQDCLVPDCNPLNGACEQFQGFQTAGIVCDTSDAAGLCDSETCDGAGSCVAGTPVDCSGTADSDTDDCVIPGCNPASGACEQAQGFETTGQLCDTADATGLCDNETCNGAGSCVAGAPVDCSGTTDADSEDCVIPACNPTNGLCEQGQGFEPNGTFCDTSDAEGFCDSEACDGAGTCVAGTPVDCSGVLDTNTDNCTIPGCDPADGACKQDIDNSPLGTICEGGDLCQTGDTCDGAGTCDEGPGTLACNANAADPCIQDICVPATGCDTQNTTNPCDFDGFDCTENDICAAGVCTQGTPNNARCDDMDACTVDICDTGAGCDNSTAVNCNDGIACTDDSCNAMTGCVNAPDNSLCIDTNPCTDAVCDTGSGCQFPVDITNTCSDGFDCTENDFCDALGSCIAGPANDALCTDDSRACAVDQCVVGAGCRLNPSFRSGTTCRPAADVCDTAEVCDGTNVDCPADAFLSNTTQCSSASCGNGEQFDEGFCTGSSAACPAATPIDCDGHECNGGAPNVCQSSCIDNSDCLGTHYCDAGDCVLRAGAGQPCTADDQCSQGDSCVDDVCCNTTCTGQCQACDVTGSVGTCTAVPAGDAPHPGGGIGAQRSACNSDGSSCGGTCDGTNVSACGFPATGTICAPPTCVNDQAREASTCNGLGACNAPDPVACDPFVCDEDNEACRGDCTLDSHCEEGLQCNAGVCVGAFSDGADCTVSTQCESGNCVDGVCCESACTGQCEACGQSGTLGQCVPVTGEPVGTRPDCGGTDECAGFCDGTDPTACTFPSTDQECRAAGCDAETSVATVTAYCDGAGSCPTAQTVECPDGCDGELCDNAECTLRSECPDGTTCLAGICVDRGDDGMTCSLDSDCANGNCVDGVCCNSACGGQCEACDVPGSLGTCTAVPEGEAPHGGRQACASDGSLCGGSCDGTTTDSCAYPATGECRPGSCTNGVAVVSATCDGSGECPLRQEQDCGADSCNSARVLCDGACAQDPDACAANEYCSAGVCVSLIPDGDACGADEQCVNGNCVDGFCCNSTCEQQCAACDVPGSEGTCSPVDGAVRGARAACSGRGACGSRCDGEDVSGCAFPGANTLCNVATCSNGVETEEAFCDGEGSCSEAVSNACESLACNDNECATGCETNDDCQGELICEDGACVVDPLIAATDKGSCGCRVPGGKQTPPGGVPWLLLAPLSLLALRRRAGGE